MKTCFCAVLTLFISAVPALAVTINSPHNGDTVNSPFVVAGSAATCSYQPVTKIGYSIDSGSDVVSVKDQVLHMNVSAAPGAHTVHVKVWGDKGSVCVKDVAVTVVSDGSDSGDSTGGSGGISTPVVPPDAVSLTNLQTMSNWKGVHDGGTNGSASGTMSLVGSPSHSGTTRKFVTKYTNKGGERYSLSFAEDQTSTNFLYDAWVYFKSPSTDIANLEMDLNETMTNGQTVIFSFQCSGYSGTWEYGTNQGTPQKPKGQWMPSKAPCNPRKWSTNTWHHVQVSYSRDDKGYITYKAVYFDGVESVINAKALGARSLGWGKAVSTNFQVDGVGSSGSSTVYLDDLAVYRW